MHCNVVRRSDIIHCEHCEVCVEGYDHHCVVFGKCFCFANIKYFSLMMVYAGAIFSNIGISFLMVQKVYIDEETETVERKIDLVRFIFGIIFLMNGVGFIGMGFQFMYKAF